MMRVTKPGGRVIIWDHNPANPYWPVIMSKAPLLRRLSAHNVVMVTKEERKLSAVSIQLERKRPLLPVLIADRPPQAGKLTADS